MGTHLDKLPAQKLRELKDHYKQRIVQLYRKPGYPQIESIRMVSCVTQEGIRDLTDRIYSAAVNAIDHDTKEHVIGMQVCKFSGILQLLKHQLSLNHVSSFLFKKKKKHA